MQTDSGKPEATEHDPEVLLRLLDLELRQKRVQWQQAAARHRTSRMMGLFSLFILVGAVVAALFFLFSQANEGRTKPLNSGISDSADR